MSEAMFERGEMHQPNAFSAECGVLTREDGPMDFGDDRAGLEALINELSPELHESGFEPARRKKRQRGVTSRLSSSVLVHGYVCGSPGRFACSGRLSQRAMSEPGWRDEGVVSMSEEQKDLFSVVKVFSTTMHRDRERLGERVTEWLRTHKELRPVQAAVTQSSDHAYHCLTITLFLVGPSEIEGSLDFGLPRSK